MLRLTMLLGATAAPAADAGVVGVVGEVAAHRVGHEANVHPRRNLLTRQAKRLHL
jgi:hypothetical protein